ncbi:uncharacterized protein F5147DRAFT_766970 [Suillus discolor]|uniref:Uncharacterized protein n=1 Tax=Suillus discolor TaxID=1912936 RepID=A0A9P7K081_9AGAM|nr:uncharacterized protein F5147DRAFT_766970 [Suillus discolor]KAG2119479.1 hypothetical protein F5147DRAFT_766970 [Suillus discolor]
MNILPHFGHDGIDISPISFSLFYTLSPFQKLFLFKFSPFYTFFSIIALIIFQLESFSKSSLLQYSTSTLLHLSSQSTTSESLPSRSACLIKEEDGFTGGVQLEFDCASFYQADEEDDHSDLALEAAKSRCKVCQAQNALADCTLEHHMVLVDLYRHRVEAANMCLLTADLNVGRMHIERKKSGISTFVGSSPQCGTA